MSTEGAEDVGVPSGFFFFFTSGFLFGVAGALAAPMSALMLSIDSPADAPPAAPAGESDGSSPKRGEGDLLPSLLLSEVNEGACESRVAMARL